MEFNSTHAEAETSTGSILKRLIQEIGSYPTLVVILCANLLESVSQIGIARASGSMIDAIIGKDQSALIAPMGFALICILLMVIGIVVKDGNMGIYLEGGLLKLKRRTARALGNAEMSWLDSRHSGDLSARAANDANTIAESLRPVLIMGLSRVLICFVQITYLLVYNWKMTLVVFCLVPITTGLQWFGSNPIRQYRKEAGQAVSSLSAVASDCFGAAETVKSYTLEKWMQSQFEQAQKKGIEAALNEAQVQAFLLPVSEFGRFIPQLLMLGAGGWFIIHQMMTFGDLMLFIALSRTVIHILSGLTKLITGLRQVAAAGSRLFELWDAPSERITGKSATMRDISLNVIQMKNVHFSYPESDELLNGVSFTLQKGAMTALVGESGSGKSTLMKITAAFYTPSEGEIYLYNENIDILSLNVIRDRFAYVTQDPYLFPGTIYENIACGKENATLDEILHAVKAAGLSTFVTLLPKGLHTPIGERGVTLSGGQRQRVSLARALVKGADLLLLDEALSALDGATESEVLNALKSLPDTPAILLSAHRLSTIREADSIIMLDQGRIVEAGDHKALMKQNGAYARLVQRQAEVMS